MDSYLKHMTELAIIIENTNSQASANEAARHISDMSVKINQQVNFIRSLPQSEQSQLLQQHKDRIEQINQRISAALTELALHDAKARRTISDAMVRLDRL